MKIENLYSPKKIVEDCICTVKEFPAMKPKINCLITAGPTREYFDPVRYISNPSSGKMGVSLAKAASNAGWNVTLILGPSDLPDPENVKTVRVVSAQEMLEACVKYFDSSNILIMSAAVSDVRPKNTQKHKLKKEDIDLTPELERTPDILKELSLRKKNQILVGFAAETDNLREYASKKLVEKNLDCIAANIVGGSKGGFASDDNQITLIMRSGEIFEFNLGTKDSISKRLIDFLDTRYFQA